MSYTASTQTHQTTSTKSSRTTAKRSDGVSLCGPCVKSFQTANETAERKERERKGPKPWLERKFAVGMVIGLFGWSSYVFWGVILKHCWDGAEDALVGFAGGVVLSIFYGFFSLMFVLTYLKILFTPPGFARDYVPHSEPPMLPEPPPFTYSRNARGQEGSYDPSHPTAYHNGNNTITYPPSRKAPTSEYRPSMDDHDRLTHETASISLDTHGEFDSAPAQSNTRLNSAGDTTASTTVGVPYELMPTRPLPAHIQTRLRSTSNTAIPPSTPKPLQYQRSRSASATNPPYPASPTTPTAQSPKQVGVLKKDSKRGSTSTIPAPASLASADPSKSQRSNKLVPAESTSSRTTATMATTQAPPPLSPSSRSFPSPSASNPIVKPPLPLPSPTSKRPAPLTTTSSKTGFQYESSSYIQDAPRLPSQSHSRTNSHTRSNPTALPSPSHTSPHTPTRGGSATPGVEPSSTHPTVDLAGRTEEFDERPVPYLDDLPPIAPSSGELRWERTPSDKPVLEPYYRYCSRDEIIKPPRSHHCRICNTCVLGYDHHCPWVGGCVGAQNRKFFVVFLFWCTLYLLYTLALLIATIVSRTNRSRSITSASLDPNIIVLLIVSALFCLFSSGMLATHVGLLSHNSSTVEWHSVQSMRERERAVISQVIPVCQCLGMGGGDAGNGGLLGRKRGGLRWDEDEEIGNRRKEPTLKGFKGRKELRKRWDREWGRIGKEGNLWWLGSNRKNWEAVMGKNPWTWFLPIGDVSGAGVDYPRNPRFDAQGRWMKRSEWPEELR